MPFQRGLGLGPPWWPSGPFRGWEAFAFCCLSLGYTDGNKTPGDLKTVLSARGINSNNIHGGGLEGSSWGPIPLEARGPPTGLQFCQSQWGLGSGPFL